MKTLNNLLKTYLFTIAMIGGTQNQIAQENGKYTNSNQSAHTQVLNKTQNLYFSGRCISDEGTVVPCKDATSPASLEAIMTINDNDVDVKVDFVYFERPFTPTADNSFQNTTQRKQSSMLQAYLLPDGKDYFIDYACENTSDLTSQARKLADKLFTEYLKK